VSHKDLHKMREFLYGSMFSNGIHYRSSYIHDMGAPMNDILWSHSLIYEDKSISLGNMSYAKYQDIINQNIIPFKKQ
jgi:hypothetical protein